MKVSADQAERICSSCSHILPVKNQLQSGFYCCDEYYCNEDCLAEGKRYSHSIWIIRHYEVEGDCYWTEWER